MSDEEQWRAVPDFEGIYEVSTRGQVRSLDRVHRGQRTRFFKGKILRQQTGRGYLTVMLRNANPGAAIPMMQIGVHRLMALAFLGPPQAGFDRVCHINDVRTDNRIENLTWGNASINGQHSVANGRHYEAAKTHCEHGHEYVEGSHSVRTAKNGRTSRVCLVCKRIETRKRRGRPHLNGERIQPGAPRKATIPERLDAAADGDQFGRVINSLFTAMEHAIEEDQ